LYFTPHHKSVTLKVEVNIKIKIKIKMDKNQLSKLIEGLAKTAEENYKNDGGLSPVLFVYHTNQKGENCVNLYPIIEEMMPKRRELMFVIGKIFLKDQTVRKVDALGFVSECCVSVMNEKDGKEAERTGNYPIPHEDPKKIEMAIVIGMTAEREGIINGYDMENKEDKQKRKLVKNKKFCSNSKDFKNELFEEFWRGNGAIIKI
jgi:hypothetical protein